MVFHFLIPVYHLISRLPNQLFLLTFFVATVIAGSLWGKFSMAPPTHFWNNPAILVLWSFSLLDWLLLSALPWLKLSFGPPEIPLMGMMAIRLTIIVASPIFWLVAGQLSSERAIHLVKMAPSLLIAINIIILVCEFEALYIEPFRLQTSKHYLSAPAVFPGTVSGRLRIVHLSDTHVEYTTRRERELIERVNELNPDLILLTGDYLNLSYLHDEQAQNDARALLSQLHAPYGVYAVSGTVDPPSVITPVFDDLEIKLLEDEIYPLSLPYGELYLIGVSNLQRQRDQVILRKLMKNVPTDAYSILLYHTPDLIETAAETGVDLALAGHTHGGQIRLPFYGALFTASIYGKKYEAGRYQVGPTTLYVSRGIGMEGSHAPRARFLCPPEIVVLDLIH